MPRISVVLPVYNHERYVEQTLRSLDAQDYRDFAIVAVDDGSTDASLEILHRHRPRIHVIEANHQGPAAARNRAIEATDSELIAFMDADDLSAPERLRVELQKLEEDKLDLVASALDFIDGDGRPLPGRWTRPAETPDDHWAALLERNWIGAPSVMIRRSVLQTTGLFDESFSHAEDYDLWLRIGQAHDIGYIDSSLIVCRRHAGNTSIGIESHQHFERMALQKVDRHAAWAAFCRAYAQADRRSEAWIWFLLRRGDAAFRTEALLASALHPRSRSLRFALGVFQYDSGDYFDALDSFDSLRDDDATALHNFGVVQARLGDIPGARTYVQAALERCPQYFDARSNLSALACGDEVRLTRRPFREYMVPMV